MKKTLTEALAYLSTLGADLAQDKPLIDLKGVIPQGDHHQTAVFIRLPYEGAGIEKHTYERVTKLLTSINRPDTIKADVFTMLGPNCVKGWMPQIKAVQADGEPTLGPLFNPDWILAEVGGYVLQITVDVVVPSVLAEACGVKLDPDEEYTPSTFAEALKKGKLPPIGKVTLKKTDPYFSMPAAEVPIFEELEGTDDDDDESEF